MIDELNINTELSQNFIDFSYEANCQRAFADARDGLKPGQRACLWEMYTKGYTSNKPHVKSAKVSGGVIGSWWPHGDAAIYDTFARMSQTWINNIPEVDWHGANGSIQISGEPAAARYTETRLSKASEDGLLSGIKKNNVSIKLNFSEDAEWPEVLPAIYPRLMVNGCQGIGSTIANVWLPHCLNELAESINEYIKTGVIDYTKLAPSFPTGGVIINKDNLQSIYKTGKGKVILRGKAEIINNNTIQITEMPYQVYVEPFIEEIKQLVVKEEIKGISNIVNKSNKNKLLIEIECDTAPLAILNQLYVKSNLQKSYNANQYALVGKTPKLLTYQQYLDVYLNHNYSCIKKEYEFDLIKSKKRLQIVDGLLVALEDIDNVICLIKSSDSTKDAITRLMIAYNLNEIQAKAIVDMKLGRLARLEKIELEQEKKDLVALIDECNNVIGSVERQKEIFLERFNTFVKKYPNKRKTTLMQINPPSKEEKEIEFVEPEKCVVVLTESGNIKRVPSSSYRTQKRNGKGIKTQDDITSMILRTNTIDSLMIFTNKGKMYRLLVDTIPVGTNSSAGQPVSTLVNMEIGEKPSVIYSIYRNTDAQYVLFTTKNGLVKKTSLEEYTKTKKKSGIAAINIREDDELVSVNLVKDEPLIILTEGGMGIKIKSTDISASGRTTMGIKGITLKSDDKVVACLPVRNESDFLMILAKNNCAKKFKSDELPIQGRGGKGLICYKDCPVVTGILISDEDTLLLSADKNSICLSAKDIAIGSRAASGTQVIKGGHAVSASKV